MRFRLLAHVTWTTLDRRRLIDADRAEFLEHFLAAVSLQEGSRLIAIGMVQTHVHLLLALGQRTDIRLLMQRLKGGSARMSSVEKRGPAERPLRWAKGYNLESVSPSLVPQAVGYLDSQSSHHPREAIEGWKSTPI